MQSLAADLAQILLGLPLYGVILLAFLAGLAFCGPAGGCLHRWRYLMVVLLALGYTASTPVFSNVLARQLESRYLVPDGAALARPARPVVVVLTDGWIRRISAGYEAKIGEAGWERLVTAVRLWRETRGTLLFTGAPTPDGTDSVAAAMARVAHAMGVPQDSLLVEGRSRNTYENLLYSAPLLGQSEGQTVILVTSAIRMPRAVAVADKLGLRVLPYPCDFHTGSGLHWQLWLPSNAGARSLETSLHELIGMLAYWWRGWI